MSKIKKFFCNFNVFWRDYFLKRYPENIGTCLESPFTGDYSSNKNGLVSFVRHHEIGFFKIDFPIDVVFTWVDDTDTDWQKKKNTAMNKQMSMFHTESLTDSRFRNRGELRYSLRSLSKFAPWINHVYLVTDKQIPSWLNTEHLKITVVDHCDIIPGQYLPTFNSHVIEAHINKIKGLSEHYIYFNDDVFLAKPVPPEHFFSSNGNVHIFHTLKEIPQCPFNTNHTPVDIAAENARALIFERFNKKMRYKVAHTFHPQLRSINKEMSDIWGNRFEEFFTNQFRGDNDIPVVTYLFPYFAYLTRRAEIRQTSVLYFSIKSPAARRNYEILKQRKLTDFAPFSMCLNDTDYAGGKKSEVEKREASAIEFLKDYFPERSPFEKDDC